VIDTYLVLSDHGTSWFVTIGTCKNMNRAELIPRIYKHDLTQTIHEWSLDGPSQSWNFMCIGNP